MEKKKSADDDKNKKVYLGDQVELCVRKIIHYKRPTLQCDALKYGRNAP